MKIECCISKKRPGAQQFSSDAVSITITSECQSADPMREAGSLFAQCNAIVDSELSLLAQKEEFARVQVSAVNGSAAHERPVNGRRRKPTPATDNQLEFIEHLLETSTKSAESISRYYQIGSLQELTVTQASEVIDELKVGEDSCSGINGHDRGVHHER